MLFPLLIKIMPLCKILEIEFSHKFIYRDDPLGFDLTHEALVYFCNRKGGCLFETGRLFFFIYFFFFERQQIEIKALNFISLRIKETG